MKIRYRDVDLERSLRETLRPICRLINIGSIMLLLSFAFVEAQVNREVIRDLRSTKSGTEFLKDHSECNLLKVLNFLADPVRYFKDVEKLPGLFDYVRAYEDYLGERDKLDDFVIYKFLQKHFRTIDRTKAEILTYLPQNSDGVYAELIAEHYTRMFETYYEIFIEDLRLRKDWESVVGCLGSGDTRAFLSGLQRAKDSDFKNELSDYVKQWIKFSGHHCVISPPLSP